MTSPSPHSREFFGLSLLKPSHPAVRRVRHAAAKTSHHGNKLWKSSALLVDYLQEFPLETASRVLEVGAGWGSCGIYCAKYFAAQVTALDIDAAVFPVLALQAEHNQVVINPLVQSLEELRLKDLQAFDVLMASDICFWDAAAAPVLELLLLAHRAGLKILISDPGRPPFIAMVDQLLKMREECGIHDIFLENWSVPHPYNISGLVLDIPASGN